MITPEKINRIQQITVLIKRLTTELSLLTETSEGTSQLTTNPEIILDMVTQVFGINPRVPSRKHSTAIVRFAATYLLKKYSRLTNKEISVLQGGVEHSVIRYRMAEARNMLDVDEDFRRKIGECMNRLELLT